MNEAHRTTQTLSLSQAFVLARRKHVGGDLDAARRIYERIAAAAPDHGETLAMLASISYCQGRDEEARVQVDRAIDLFRAAVQNRPHDPVPRASVVNLLLARGRHGEAEALTDDLVLPLNPIRATAEEFAARRAAAMERGRPTIVISTVPKSASESIWNKLAEGLGLAQCYLSIGLFPDCCLIPARVREAARGGIITKEHIGPTRHNLDTLRQAGIDRVVVHHRDPRQATLSWAHFVREDVGQRVMAPLWRKIVPPAHLIAGDFAALLDWCIDHYLPLLIGFLADWRAVAAQTRAPVAVLFESFEDFRTEPDAYFRRVLDFYGIAPEEFAADAEAKVVHLRKGQIDEWRSVFSADQKRRAWQHIPADMAADFGWEA
ncbi:MAG: hypothetical protein D6826_06905 [Alphaproteobacteria bacterium]|nr:MAG: hypothetical protein D6826_06905 [Alphaproteobacteria bacterium]